MYGNYGFGGESDETILRRGPPCGTSPSLINKARWGFNEASNTWGWTGMFSLGILPFVVYPMVGKIVMKDASYKKRLLVTNAAILLGLTIKNFGAGEKGWEWACERAKKEAAYKLTDEYAREQERSARYDAFLARNMPKVPGMRR